MSGDSVADAEAAVATAGYYGKVPVRGDFLSNGLPRDFIDPWDDWIQVAFEESRVRFSEQWLDYYLTSPLWHFAVAPAVCGDRSWAGVLMPSVDAVGRYFPLTIAVPLEPGINILTVLSSSQEWFERAERLARSCLDDDFDLDGFDAEIRLLTPPDGVPVPRRADELVAAGDRLSNAWRYGLASAEPLSLDCPSLLHEMLDRLLYAYSLWWTPGSTRVSPTYLISQGLPPPQGYAAMLDGNWQKWGWDDRQIFDPGQLTDQLNPDAG